MRTIMVNPDGLTVGDHVTVWHTVSHGQGGLFVGVTDGVIEIDAPIGRCSWPLATIARVTTEVPLDAEECLEFGDDCRGPVDYHTVGRATQAWPRCEFHIEQRWARYEDSIERYADSDVPPAWFDPSIAGESWD